jgi:hypothetical protein
VANRPAPHAHPAARRLTSPVESQRDSVPAFSGPVCPGIALLLGDGAKPPENRQNLPVDTLGSVWQDGAAMNEIGKQFSFTRAAPSTRGAAKSNFLSAKVKSGCSEGESPSSLGQRSPRV